MNNAEMQYIEKLIENAYSSQNPSQRSSSIKYHNELMQFTERLFTLDNINTLLVFLSQTSSYIAFYYVCSQINRIFTRHLNSFSLQYRKEIRQMLLMILHGRSDWLCDTTKGAISNLARDHFSKLISRVHRLCWFELDGNTDLANAQGPSNNWDPDFDTILMAHWWGNIVDVITSIEFGDEEIKSKEDMNDDNKLNQSEMKIKNLNESDGPMLHLVAMKLIIENPTLKSTLMGCTILSDLVSDMCVALPRIGISLQRKIAKSFMENCLLDIFPIVLSTTQKILATSLPLEEPELSQHKILTRTVLGLVQHIFSYDIIEINPSELNDMPRITHMPRSWKRIFMNPDLLHTYLQCYTSFEPPLSTTVLEILTSIVSVNCTTFGTPNNQTIFLTNLFHGLGKILQTRQGLDNSHNRHQFCRFLMCLNWNFELTQIINVPTWKEFISLTATFHLEILDCDDATPSIVYYIMTWWSRMCNSSYYLSSGTDSRALFEYFPMITIHFIKTQLKKQESGPPPDHLDILSSEQLNPILSPIPIYLHCVGKIEVSNYLIELFTQLGTHFAAFNTHNPPALPHMLLTIQRQLAFITHIATVIYRSPEASIILYKDQLSSNDDLNQLDQLDSLNVNMVSCVFHILQIHDQMLANFGNSEGCQLLEYALVCFLRRFSTSYFKIEDIEKTNLHMVLSQKHGLVDKFQILEAILSKIATNFKNWPSGSNVSTETLQLFWALVNAPSSYTILNNMQIIVHLLTHHIELNLGDSPRNRYEFYRILGKLAFRNNDISTIYMFLSPFEAIIMDVQTRLQEAKASDAENLANTLIAILRDLRAVIESCTTQQSYEIFFDWFYPSSFFQTLCVVAAQRYMQFEPRVIWAIFKLVTELTADNSNRIRFPNTSAHGHRLFRDVANLFIIIVEGMQHLSSNDDSSTSADELAKDVIRLCTISANNENTNADLLASSSTNNIADGFEKDISTFKTPDMRYKFVLLYLRAISSTLHGVPFYANLAVFQFYGDDIVRQLIHTTCNIIFSITNEEVQAYPKIAKTMYQTLGLICTQNLIELLSQDLEVIAEHTNRILIILKGGLSNSSVNILSSVTHSIYKVALNQFQSISKQRQSNTFSKILNESHRQTFGAILFELFDILLLQPDKNHMTLSESIFILIQLIPETYGQIRDIIIKSQSHIAGRTELLEVEFKNLTQDLDSSISSKNRERFIINAMDFKTRCEPLIDSHRLYQQGRALLADIQPISN